VKKEAVGKLYMLEKPTINVYAVYNDIGLVVETFAPWDHEDPEDAADKLARGNPQYRVETFGILMKRYR